MSEVPLYTLVQVIYRRATQPSPTRYSPREFFIDNLLVRIHFIILMIRWTGLAGDLLRDVPRNSRQRTADASRASEFSAEREQGLPPPSTTVCAGRASTTVLPPARPGGNCLPPPNAINTVPPI